MEHKNIAEEDGHIVFRARTSKWERPLDDQDRGNSPALSQNQFQYDFFYKEM